MPDTHDPETRSRTMRAVKGSNTTPELILRKALWKMGARGYRVHRKDIPGSPDIAWLGRKVAVFVDGAFWHGRADKFWPGRSSPYWDRKIARNMERDRRVNSELSAQGWTVIRVWDDEVTKYPEATARRIIKAL